MRKAHEKLATDQVRNQVIHQEAIQPDSHTQRNNGIMQVVEPRINLSHMCFDGFILRQDVFRFHFKLEASRDSYHATLAQSWNLRLGFCSWCTCVPCPWLILDDFDEEWNILKKSLEIQLSTTRRTGAFQSHVCKFVQISQSRLEITSCPW